MAEGKKEASEIDSTPFIAFVGGMQFLFIVLFFALADYGEAASGGGPYANNLHNYGMFQDVHVMIFVGFGFLMTFLRRQGFTSLGMTFLISTFCIQWYSLISGITGLFFGHSLAPEFTLETILFGDFLAAAVLITYGVLLGKVSPFQMMLITFIESFFFTINEHIAIELGVTDIGGSMIVHMFGAFFGMAVSIVMVGKFNKDSDDNSSVVNSDIFAMVGSLFLWMYWPSFNSILGAGNDKERAVVNTVISISASCVMAFVTSRKIREENKFDMVDIQNATLAGGVAMGTCANFLIGPGAAALIGSIAGIISVIGYVHISPMLEEKINLTDTCGVNNLHGIPSVIGATAGIIATALANDADFGEQWMWGTGGDPTSEGYKTPGEATTNQLVYMLVTLAFSMISGALTGVIMNALPTAPIDAQYNDSPYWGVSPDYAKIGKV